MAPPLFERSSRLRRILLVVCVLVAGIGPRASASAGLVYQPPVDSPIVDHFRPPACLWCAGNRGIDYSPPPGTPVRAANNGRVTFAGRVGFDMFVVITHDDGLRTTYGYLGSIAVSEGQWVARGTVVATSGIELHFGVRRGDVYLDPEQLFGARLRARLVPLSGRARS